MKEIEVDGTDVPALGLGTWQSKGGECEKAVRKALNLGYRHVDTAQVYGNEKEVGRGIEASEVDREEIFLTTKVWRDSLDPEKLKQSVEESLEMLQTEYVDLLLIHWPFPDLDLEGALREMEDLVDEGKTRRIGVSNFTAGQLDRAREISDATIFTNQVEYHPFLDQSRLLERCRETDTVLTAYSPLARGEVLGNDTLKEIGERHGKSPAQVALRWHLQQDMVAAIPKATGEKHIEENLDVFDFRLTEDEIQTIHGLARDDRKVDPEFAPDWD
ncbi:MAG: aldo/keto reductase [Candidatus Nanohaloarchaea archaeon]